MNKSMLQLIIPFLGGTATGLVNYLGLWQTVQMVTAFRRPLLLIMLSMLGRTVACLAIFYLLMDHRWERLLACLAGFFLVRVIALKRIGPNPRLKPGGLSSSAGWR